MACDAASGKLVPRAQGACDDGDKCTADDHCEAGNCQGTQKACDDAVGCNGQEGCDGASGECTAGTPTCQDQICDVTSDECVTECAGCTIDQVCYQHGVENPLNPCELCNATLDDSGWTVALELSCGDDDACQFNHRCNAQGECQFDVEQAGLGCSGPTPDTTCANYVCDGAGACVLDTATPSTPCGPSDPCQKQDHCDGQGSCADAGPQALGFACKANATCTGSGGAPSCECSDGAELWGDACVDIDECSRNADDCDPKPDACVNDVLGFHCACPGNYGGDGVGAHSCTCAQSDWSPLCEPWSMVAVQSSHACAISGGAVFCWGSNKDGQLGSGDKTTRLVPTRVGTDSDWDFITVGHDRTCGIRAGALYCWGDNGSGWLGTGDANPTLPGRVGSESDWTTVAASIGVVCGTRGVGELYCWGWNEHGQLGQGYTSTAITTPALVATLSGVSKISLENDNVCAIAAGKLYCWGGNSTGELGNGSTPGYVTSPTRVTQWDDFVDVDAGTGSTCATRGDGTLYCFGSPYPSTPTQVGSESDWQSVSSGFYECAQKQDGSAYCWGGGSDGQLGDGAGLPRKLPTEVAGDQPWEQVVASQYTSCGIRDGGLYCWGSNQHGLRGIGFNAGEVGSDSDWSAIAAASEFSCGIKAGGHLYCWGRYPGSADRPSPWVPSLIGQASDDDWTEIHGSYGTACGIKGGDAYCWGDNTYGQVGNGGGAAVTAPVAVGAAGLWQQLSMGASHACGIRDGNLYCWGKDDYGQIGNGAGTAPSTPELIASGGYTAVAAGYTHTCAVKFGALYCWGSDSQGEVGNGAATNAAGYASPVKIGSADNWVGLSSGMAETCGLQATGTVSCWGWFKDSPTAVAGAWQTISTAGTSRCGVRTDGKMYCWGSNAYGQLATGNNVTASLPTLALGGATIQAVSSSNYYGCAVTTAGTLSCWGDNEAGALGRSEGLLPGVVFDPTVD